MPNWCQNVLIVAGSDDKIKEFKREARFQTEQEVRDLDLHEPGEFSRKNKSTQELMKMEQDNIAQWLKQPFTFHKLVPQPPKNERDYGSEEGKTCEGGWDWYNWNISNWGTKWDVSDCGIEQRNKNELTYRFNTAWSPPEQGIETVSRKFPELSFLLVYFEAGIGFMGKTFFEDGHRNELVLVEGFFSEDRGITVLYDEDFAKEEGIEIEEAPIIGLESDDPEIEDILSYGFGMWA